MEESEKNLVDVDSSLAKIDGNFLKYDAAKKKWIGEPISVETTVVKFDEADTDPVTKIRRMDQSTYDALVNESNVEANTLYIIVA